MPTAPPIGTNDQIAQQLTSGYWGGQVHNWAVAQGGTITVDLHTLTAAEQDYALTALSEWGDVIGVHFQQVTSGAQIVFSDADLSTGEPVAETYVSYASGIITSATVQISSNWTGPLPADLDNYGFQTYLHEIGHALGLGHPGNYGYLADGPSVTYANDAMFANDAYSTSVMSYFGQRDNTYFANQGFSGLWVLTPMVADIVAMQSLYGLSTTTRAGDTVYGDHSNAGGVYDASLYPNAAFTIFDSGGNDTIDYSLSSANQLINLNPETFSNVNGWTGNLEIARGTVIEDAVGGTGNDIIIGSSMNNVLTGNGGADKLTGGGGKDTFSDTEAGHNGDTITDFRPGDAIVFTDATAAAFSFTLSGNSLTYTGGAMTLNGAVHAHLAETTTASGSVQLSESHSVANDFNGDGRSDILWRNDSGYLTDWLSASSGAFVSNSGNGSTSGPDSSWQIVGTGDFNGDGISDILWRNSSGYVSDWLGNPNGSFTPNGDNAGSAAANTSWQVAGTGDFNGDGLSDILWRNSSGYLTEWLGTSTGGFTDNGSAAANGAADNSWQIVGTGDFNGDGMTDILWRNASGYLTEWLGTSTGAFVSNQANAGNGSADTSWQVVGTGDFNADGMTDILWRNASGYLTEWLGTPNGGFTDNAANAATGAADNSWQIAQIGDFNGDGRSDILWRNSSGYTTEWLGTSTGAFTDNAAIAATGAADNSWHVQEPFI